MENRQGKNYSSKLLNITLQTLENSVPNTQICKYRNTLDQQDTTETMHDEFHINRTTAAETIVNELSSILSQTDSSTPTSPEKIIPIPAEKAGRVIGKFQGNLRQWANKYQVAINLVKGDTPSLIVSGRAEDIQKVEIEIQTLLKNTEQTDSSKYQREMPRHPNAGQPTPNQRWGNRAIQPENQDESHQQENSWRQENRNNRPRNPANQQENQEDRHQQENSWRQENRNHRSRSPAYQQESQDDSHRHQQENPWRRQANKSHRSRSPANQHRERWDAPSHSNWYNAQ